MVSFSHVDSFGISVGNATLFYIINHRVPIFAAGPPSKQPETLSRAPQLSRICITATDSTWTSRHETICMGYKHNGPVIDMSLNAIMHVTVLHTQVPANSSWAPSSVCTRVCVCGGGRSSSCATKTSRISRETQNCRTNNILMGIDDGNLLSSSFSEPHRPKSC